MYSKASAGEGLVAFLGPSGDSTEAEDQSVAAKMCRRAASLALFVGRVMALRTLEASSGTWKTWIDVELPSATHNRRCGIPLVGGRNSTKTGLLPLFVKVKLLLITPWALKSKTKHDKTKIACFL